MKPIPTVIKIKFLGSWATWRECASIREGQRTLAYWRGRSSWPLKMERR